MDKKVKYQIIKDGKIVLDVKSLVEKDFRVEINIVATKARTEDAQELLDEIEVKGGEEDYEIY